MINEAKELSIVVARILNAVAHTKCESLVQGIGCSRWYTVVSTRNEDKNPKIYRR